MEDGTAVKEDTHFEETGERAKLEEEAPFPTADSSPETCHVFKFAAGSGGTSPRAANQGQPFAFSPRMVWTNNGCRLSTPIRSSLHLQADGTIRTPTSFDSWNSPISKSSLERAIDVIDGSSQTMVPTLVETGMNTDKSSRLDASTNTEDWLTIRQEISASINKMSCLDTDTNRLVRNQ